MKNVLIVAVFLVAAGLAAALIAVSIAGGSDDAGPAVVHEAAATEALFAGVPQRGNVLGNPDAPVTIVEYGDYQCPACAQWARETLPAIVEEYVRPGKAKVVFQGIVFLGEDSLEALQATVSAGRQDKLWNVGHALFHNQGAEASGWVTDELLRAIGESVSGLDVDEMMDGRDSADVGGAIGRAHSAAQAAGVTVTPSFEVGRAGASTTLMEGALPLGEFRQVLDSLLEE